MPFLSWFALVAIAEMATLFWVGSRIGLGWALGIALTTAIIGSILVKRAGLSVLRQIKVKLDQVSVPGRELTHGAAILVAGAFLISPGFITDTIGFLLLIPAIRDLIHGQVTERLGSRATVLSSGGVVGASDQTVIDVEEID